MKNYYSIEGKLYSLTNKQKKELEKLHPSVQTNEQHEEKLQWIEDNGKYIGPCENFAY